MTEDKHLSLERVPSSFKPFNEKFSTHVTTGNDQFKYVTFKVPANEQSKRGNFIESDMFDLSWSVL